MQGYVRLICKHHNIYLYLRPAVGPIATLFLELWWLQDMGHVPNFLNTFFFMLIFLLWRSISWLFLGFGLISCFLPGNTLFKAEIFRISLSIPAVGRWKITFSILDLVPEYLHSSSSFALVNPLQETSIFFLCKRKIELEWLVYKLCFRRLRCSENFQKTL